MLGIAMAEIVLNQTQVITLIGKIKTTGMSKHMRMYRAEFGALRRCIHQVIHRLPGHGLIALGQKQPGQRIAAGAEIAFDGPQLIAGDRVLDR
ncbi:MAG TPA: hypothetical protein P5329_08935 [Candidatus Competibacteraceae bacterium]|nr:hypothetical protein [Candidatus Competibacteraceae bacterium]